MSKSLSILGLYNYDNTLFDKMALPAGVDKDTVLKNLLMELTGLELVYPDGDFMKNAIGFWSAKELPVWTKLYATTTIEYDPIANIRRTETYDDTETRNLGNSNKKKTVNSGTDTENNFTSGFNETTPVLSGKNEQTQGTQIDEENSGTDSGTVSNKRTVQIDGSIGVVLTQQMIEAERRVSTFNIVDYITTSFKKRFCILVY